jgi:hypothetical protein
MFGAPPSRDALALRERAALLPFERQQKRRVRDSPGLLKA